MSPPLKAGLGIVAALAAAGLLVFSYSAHRSEITEEAESEQPIGKPPTVSRDAAGQTVVKFDNAMQQRADIRAEPLRAITHRQTIQSYGHLEEDPALSFILRSPVAGTVRASQDRPWPDVGQPFADGSVVGLVQPRLAPADRITLRDRLASARAEVTSSRASLATAQAALTRARALNADDKNISDRALQDAESRVATEQARLTAATESVNLIESALASSGDAASPLQLERGGQVVEVLVHPGESVESGQPILRAARFDRLLARVDVPAGDAVAAGLSAADIVPLGYQGRPLRGERVSLAASVDPKTQGQPFLFRIADPSLTLRPGLSVTAFLETPGPPSSGVAVPRAAVVRQSGKAWIYLQTGPDLFARREVVLEDPIADGWFSRSPMPGDRVVTSGAQTLLSEEFKSQIQVGEENPQ